MNEVTRSPDRKMIKSCFRHHESRVVIKSQWPGIFSGYYECGPRLLLLENRRKIEPKEAPSCLNPRLLVVFTRQLEILGRFPFIRTGRPDHYQTSYFDNETGFFQGFLLNNHLLPAYYLGFDWCSGIVMINSEILITSGRVWPVSSDKWKAPLVTTLTTFEVKLVIGTLRNHDDDGNGNVKKTIGLMSKTTALHVHHTTTTWNA